MPLNVQSFIARDVKQWKHIHHDDFQSPENVKDWSHVKLQTCRDGENYFLGGHCNFATETVTKVFRNLPKHEKIKISATFHMFDNWEDEMALMKVNDKIGNPLDYSSTTYNLTTISH